MQIVYLDTSWILNKIIDPDNNKTKPLLKKEIISSELSIIECGRFSERLRNENKINDEQLAEFNAKIKITLNSINLIRMNRQIKKRAAEFFPTSVKTLDAIHLATALKVEEENQNKKVYFITDDYKQEICARALGFETGI